MSAEYEKMQVEPWVNPADAADYIGITQDTARTWAREEKLPPCKVEKRYKFKLSEINDWVRNNGNTDGKGADADE